MPDMTVMPARSLNAGICARFLNEVEGPKFESSLGSVGIKESESGNFKIEFSDLQRIAAEHKIPIMKARLKIETEFESSRI